MTKELYIKFLNDQCTSEEIKEVIQWIGSDVFGEKGRKWGFEHWKSFHDVTNAADDEKFREMFDKIQSRIDNETAKERKPKAGKTLLMSWITRAAAILFIPLLTFFLYTVSEKEIASGALALVKVDTVEVISPIGSRTVLQLSDGTEVHLNFGSRLKYPRTFTGNTREVTLEGEGYFDVVHNPEKPFMVKTGKLNVQALGTAFNVLAYGGDDVIETTLIEGKVVLEKILPEGQHKALGALLPGQHVNYNAKTGNITSTRGNVDKYIAWKEGKMVFDDTPISEIARLLERKYNVEIEVQDDIKDYYYTVTFLDEPLTQILELMTIATPVRYEVLPRKKLHDGTFSKQKILITSRIKK